MIKRYSDHAANERTFLAWVRTAIALMAFGFVIERFDLFLQAGASQKEPQLNPPGSAFANAASLASLKKGGPYPDGAVFLDDLHDFTVADGAYAEGPLKALTMMVKDAKMHASTGGWGFQAWAAGDPSKPIVTDAVKQCFECHQPQKDQDYVYSSYIP